MKYWSFSKGQFVRRVDENTKGATPRILEKGPNEGKQVFEIFSDEMVGLLVDIKIKESEYGKSFQFILDVTTDDNNPEFYAIDFKFNGSGKSLLKKLPNIDLDNDIALVCYTMDGTNAKGDPIKNYYAVPYQGAINKTGKVLPAYTKEEPNGFPEMKKVKIKGKEQWDDTDQIEFLEDLINSIEFQGLPSQEEKETPEEAPKAAESEEPFLEPEDEENVGF